MYITIHNKMVKKNKMEHHEGTLDGIMDIMVLILIHYVNKIELAMST